MAGRAALIATDRSGARRCRGHPPGEHRRPNAPAVTDRPAPKRHATRPVAQSRLLPDAEIVAVQASWLRPAWFTLRHITMPLSPPRARLRYAQARRRAHCL